MAKKAKGTAVLMQTGALAAAKTITGITKANPAVVSCSAHGYTDGDIVVITGVVGMQEVNNRAFVVDGATGSPLAPNSFKLKGVDSSTYTTYTSGGGAQKATLAAIGEVRNIGSMGGTTANPIDVTHLQSVGAETLAGQSTQQPITFEIWFDVATAGHKDLLLADQDKLDRAFHFSHPSPWHMSVLCQVGGVAVTSGDANSAISASVSLLPRAATAWTV